jgi:hypothetical protein
MRAKLTGTVDGQSPRRPVRWRTKIAVFTLLQRDGKPGLWWSRT